MNEAQEITHETPYISIDATVMRANIARMAELARARGVTLRPHIKTHKIPAFALEQLQAGAVGITVAKPAEAEVMAEAGIRDIFIAYPVVVPSKIDRVLALARNIELAVGVDSAAGAALLSKRAAAAGMTLQVRLELDTGLRRTGAQLHEAVELGRTIALMPGLELSGIFTFKGAVLRQQATLDVAAAGKEEGELMVQAAERLRAAGVGIRHVSVGSTPTAAAAAAVPGVTEVRPGTYIFNDRMLERMGVCSADDWAARVRVTVVSVPAPNRAVVDGGSKTFATDVQPGNPPLNLEGFGAILGHPDAVLEKMNEEHGMIRSAAPHGWSVGDTLDIVPNHICSTVNLHNAVWLREPGGDRRIAVAARGMLS
ncbi:alanine racemase [Paenibacillus sp. IB182496]|uniref:Alanine racemase n=1 Tax=Paenibacillus sabuli TaxID=2772509 RepID=A0A927BT35_9BACL|nr:alanine racemase [Paenibacillus sabuli]MBD2845797.1 alanine racemase [Paenibacillus sabuli]